MPVITPLSEDHPGKVVVVDIMSSTLEQVMNVDEYKHMSVPTKSSMCCFQSHSLIPTDLHVRGNVAGMPDIYQHTFNETSLIERQQLASRGLTATQVESVKDKSAVPHVIENEICGKLSRITVRRLICFFEQVC